MLLKLIRTYHRVETTGVLYIDNQYFCTTIEPPIGPRTGPIICPTVSVANDPMSCSERSERSFSRRRSARSACCIPEGWYRIDVTLSPRFKRPMPLLRQVPGFEGIRMHAGMNVHNTTGCICVGERWKENQLTKLLIQAQNRHETIYIVIATDYALSRQLSHDADLDSLPSIPD